MVIEGAKKNKKAARKPHIQKDTTASINHANILYLLSEGEIYGLADGAKSIRLDETPIVNDNGQPNFENIWWDFRPGTVDQTHIQGFGSVTNETSVNVELRHDRPYVRAFNNTMLDAISVRLAWGALSEQKDNGDIVGYRIDYAIDLQTDGGAYQEVLRTFIHDKASQGYQRSHRIDLPRAKRGWTLRVRRLTPNRDSELVGDRMSVAAVTEAIDAKMRHPHTALLALRYDAETFGNIAKLSVRLKGRIIQVPSNYNSESRTYHGIWDGTFKLAYTNNPAWVFYDLCTHKRYGLGDRLTGKVDKWSLYKISQYCDEMVDDGQGGKEPRFTCNVYLQQSSDAYQVLQSLASVFRGLMYWNGTQIIVDSDTPRDPVYTYTRSNVVNGEFVYTGTRKRDRHNLFKVAWDNPDNDYKTEYEQIRNDYAIAKYGVSMLEINAFGCTSRSQAHRVGEWAKRSEQFETESVTFSTAIDSFIPNIGEVINIADDLRAGRAVGGRIESVNNRQITLDRKAGKAGDTLVVNTPELVTAKVLSVKNGNVLTVDKTIPAKPHDVWGIQSKDLVLQQYRVMSVAHGEDGTINISAIQYQPLKYSDDINITPPPMSIIRTATLPKPESVLINMSHRNVQGQSVTTLTIDWTQVEGAVAYIVEWQKDNNGWQINKVASQSFDIDGVYSGNYQARVRAVDAFGNEGEIGSSIITPVTGKVGKPPKPVNLTIEGVLFGMVIKWQIPRGAEDASYTELQVSPDGRSNIATLGQFGYPTNSHAINGLQGNLTQFYRARLVDKIGNTSDWTEWAEGSTSADTNEILENLSTQIVENELDKILTGKIGGITEKIDNVGDSVKTLPRTIDVEYYLSNSSTSLTGGQWQTGSPNWTVGKYIWQRTKLTLSNGSVQYKPSPNGVNIQGAKGDRGAQGSQGFPGRDGQDGRGIRSVTDFYLLTNSATPPTLSTGGWQTRAQPTTTSNRYLWSYERTDYTDGSHTNSEVVLKGAHGETGARGATGSRGAQGATGAKGADGRGVKNIIDYYMLTNSSSAPSLTTSGWVTTAPATNEGNRYLWSYERIEYTDGAHTTSSIVLKGVHGATGARGVTGAQGVKGDRGATGAKGDKGDSGRGIKSITDYYILTNSPNAPSVSTGGWQTRAQPTTTSNRYLWSYERTDYTDGSHTNSEVVLKGAHGETGARGATGSRGAQGATGAKGADGRGVKAVSEQYYLSTSKTQTISGSWVDSAPTWQMGRFIWIRTKVTYSDNQVEYTTPFVSSEWEGVLSHTNSELSKIQGIVNAQTPKIQNIERTFGNAMAIKAVTVDNNGFISGYGIMSELVNGRVISRFGINADQIYFGNSMSDKKPFIVNTRGQWQGGVYYPAGAWIDSAYIANSSITNAHIANAAITTAKIENGAISTAKIGTAQVDTLQIAGEAVIVPRAQTLVGRGGQGWQGDAFDLTINTAGSAVVVNAVFSIDVWKTENSRKGSSDRIFADVDSEVRIDLFCNGSLITQGVYSFRDYAENTDSNILGRSVTARDDKTVGIYNFMHVSPPHNARYQTKLSVTHRSRGTQHSVYQGSILVMAVKR